METHSNSGEYEKTAPAGYDRMLKDYDKVKTTSDSEDDKSLAADV